MSRRRTAQPGFEVAGAYAFSHRGLSIWHLIPWLWPWCLAVAVGGLGAGLHMLWGRSLASAPWAAVGICLVTVGLTALAYRAGQARGPLIRAGAALAVAVAGVWLLWALLVAPWRHPVLDVWIALALAGPIAANVLRGLRGQGQDSDGGEWGELRDKLKIPGARLSSVKRVGEHTVTAKLKAGPGQTAEDLVAAVPRIASVAGTPAGGARGIPNPDHAGEVSLTLVTRDLLRDPIPWRGLSAPGTSILDHPIRGGVRESGDDLGLWLPADERTGRSAQHVLITGQTGSGKSVFGRVFLAEVLSRSDVQVWLADCVKGRQFTGPFIDRVHRLATSEKDVEAMIGELPAIIAKRADELGARGFDNWQPGCGMPYWVVHVEEAAVAIARSRAIVTAMQTGRSAGLTVVLSQQRVTHTSMPVDARQQAGTVLQFGCRKGDERHALRAETLEAGAAPQNWGNSRPGMVYAETPGSAPEQWSAPARIEMATAAEISAALGVGQPEPEPDEPQMDETLQLPPEFTPAEARQMLRSALSVLHRDGRVVVRPRDLADVRESVLKSPAWLTGELGRLVEEGILVVRERGVYAWGADVSALSPAGARS
ncbi:FtsK/SpoIIIE domain-containing protein [Lysinibacillus fusiformis]|uniref:FtsK/SpoIIIE domain-containing protein n=1 Tax=Lysinibacillus fusiformis TaxID=28031 RepID=UPI003D08C19D